MFGGMNPKKMQQAMKKLGIQQEEIDASRVIIEKQGSNIIIDNPSIVKINMQGNESFQISGDVSEEADEGVSEDDVNLVIEKTGKTEEEVKQALEKSNGDITEAIMSLSD